MTGGVGCFVRPGLTVVIWKINFKNDLPQVRSSEIVYNILYRKNSIKILMIQPRLTSTKLLLPLIRGFKCVLALLLPTYSLQVFNSALVSCQRHSDKVIYYFTFISSSPTPRDLFSKLLRASLCKFLSKWPSNNMKALVSYLKESAQQII